MSNFVLREFRPGDASRIARVQRQYADQDLVDPYSTLESLPTEADVLKAFDAADRYVVAETEAGEVLGWGSLRSWVEDGLRVFLTDGYVSPPYRRLGVGTLLFRNAEAAARDALLKAPGGSAVLGGNASSVQPDRAALLVRQGLAPVFSMVEMELMAPEPLASRLPEGLVLREVVVADACELTALTERVWADRAYFSSPTASNLGRWLTRSDLSLFQAATCNGDIVGFVASRAEATHAEIEDVQVDPAWQRRGLATALLAHNLALLADRRVARVRLHTEGHDPAGARTLYERLGFKVVREYGRYRKPV